jgi:Zn-finger nucleic acid-binding protein
VIRAWAGFDLLVTGLLALPPTARAFVEALYALEAALFGGTAAAPELPAVAWLFVNLAGALGVLWAGVRLARPEPWLGRADALARCGVAALIAGYVAGGAVPRVLLGFVATELLGAVAQARSLGPSRGPAEVERFPLRPCPDCGGELAPAWKFRVRAPACRGCGGVWLASDTARPGGSGIAAFHAFPESGTATCPQCGGPTLEHGRIGIAHARACRACGGTFRPGAAYQHPRGVVGA